MKYELDLPIKKVHIFYTYLILNENFSSTIFLSILHIEWDYLSNFIFFFF